MPQPLETSFRCYTFSPEEEKEALTYTELQRKYLENMEGMIAHKILNLRVDTANVSAFVQDDAYLKGQLEILQELLAGN